jgi:hypothetical protein
MTMQMKTAVIAGIGEMGDLRRLCSAPKAHLL